MAKAIMLEPIGGDTLPYVIPAESSRTYSFEIGTDKSRYRIFAKKRDDSTTGRHFCSVVGYTANTRPSNMVAFESAGFGIFSTSFFNVSYIDGILTISSDSNANTYFRKGVKYYYEVW